MVWELGLMMDRVTFMSVETLASRSKVLDVSWAWVVVVVVVSASVPYRAHRLCSGVFREQGCGCPRVRPPQQPGFPTLLPSSCQFCLGTKNSRVESCPSGQGWWAALQGTLASLSSSLTATPCCPALPGLARAPMSSCRRLSQGQDGRCLALPCPQRALDS